MSARYIFDTNIWVDVGRGTLTCEELRNRARSNLALAPLVIIELVLGTVKAREARFAQNKSMIECMAAGEPEILELPLVFVNKVVWNLAFGKSEVRPSHYRTLLNQLVGSGTRAEFLKKAEQRDSPWNKMTDLPSIHEGVLEKELKALEALGVGGSLHARMAKTYRFAGLFPDPDWFAVTFSAAIEFTRSWLTLVRNGAKPRKNNRGMYIDSQLFWYLADPDMIIVTEEDFTEITASPQKSRIISFEEFRART
jgi:hypothetical protein